MSGALGERPQEAVATWVTLRGQSWVVDRCLEVLTLGEVDAHFLVGLSGRHAEAVLQGREGGVEGYWPRVWVLRALLYNWEPRATPAVAGALNDGSWRVREMALKVMIRHHVEVSNLDLDKLTRDPVARVREARARLDVSQLDVSQLLKP